MDLGSFGEIRVGLAGLHGIDAIGVCVSGAGGGGVLIVEAEDVAGAGHAAHGVFDVGGFHSQLFGNVAGGWLFRGGGDGGIVLRSGSGTALHG